MPREVKAYACEFKCGRNTTTKKGDMVKHEKQCPWNASHHACPTCKHDASEYQEFLERFCAIDKRPENKKIIANCEHWEADDE